MLKTPIGHAESPMLDSALLSAPRTDTRATELHPREELRGSLAFKYWEHAHNHFLMEPRSEHELVARLRVNEDDGEPSVCLPGPEDGQGLVWALRKGSVRQGDYVTCFINLLTPSEEPLISRDAPSTGMSFLMSDDMSLEIPALPRGIHVDGSGSWDVWLRVQRSSTVLWTPICRASGFEAAVEYGRDIASVLGAGSIWPGYNAMYHALERNGVIGPQPEE